MIIHLLIGALGMGTVWFLFYYAHKNELKPVWWQWIVAMLAVCYAAFVLEVIYGFLLEGVPKAAMVMGLVTALPAVIWFVLLFRFVFSPNRSAQVEG